RVPSSFSHKEEIRPLCGATQEKQRGRTPYASLFSIHLWIPRVLIVQKEKRPPQQDTSLFLSYFLHFISFANRVGYK
ncbi:hypothetical protein HMPREF0083_04497, partial [Aneurinibacillus aneurinilyticus ATCC 12856]